MRRWGRSSLSSRSKDNAYGRRAALLTVVSLLAKVVGALYRIPLTNIIGAEGVGLYQLIFSIYALALALTSAFSSTLISRQVSGYLALGDEGGARGYFATAMAESLISSALVGAALFLFGERIASAQGAAGGGLGATAVTYGLSYRQYDIMYAASIMLVVLVQVITMTGTFLSRKHDHRIR